VKEQSMYDIYGGVPRSLQSKDGKKMIKALLKKGSIVASNFFKGSKPGTGPDIEKSYTLVHLVPKKKGNNTYDYFSKRATVASRYVVNVLQNTSDNEVFRAAKNSLQLNDAGGLDAAVLGYFFEEIFYREYPAEMNLNVLNKKGSRAFSITSNVTKTIKTPTDKYKYPKDFKNWTSNVFYFPISRTLESADAFFIQGPKEQSELYILQLTVASTHSVQANGLLKIVKYFEDSGYKIDSKSMMMHLVFVLPQKANIREGLRNPVKPFTNYQAITKMEDNTTSVISKSEDERITKLFETQTQWLSYYIIINQ